MAKSDSKISQLFQNLEYGPAPESPNIAYEWFNSHDKKFGHFINGKWVQPEGRKEVECKSPATGDFISSFIHSFFLFFPTKSKFAQELYSNRDFMK